MINTVVITGRFTKDPELKKTKSGTSVTQFVIAVQRPYKDAQGNHRQADFISCVAWKKTAENIITFFKKGNLIGLDGRLQTRNYQDKNGNTVYVTELLVERVHFLESKKEREEATDKSKNSSQAKPASNDSNADASATEDPFAGSGDLDITDEDLPF